ncbi:MAG TPA: hypothetical protein VK249_07040 [Anaerolineales bacterium]|nr:hypothetical protein [Anaerolineales bacterium]
MKTLLLYTENTGLHGSFREKTEKVRSIREIRVRKTEIAVLEKAIQDMSREKVERSENKRPSLGRAQKGRAIFGGRFVQKRGARDLRRIYEGIAKE